MLGANGYSSNSSTCRRAHSLTHRCRPPSRYPSNIVPLYAPHRKIAGFRLRGDDRGGRKGDDPRHRNILRTEAGTSDEASVTPVLTSFASTPTDVAPSCGSVLRLRGRSLVCRIHPKRELHNDWPITAAYRSHTLMFVAAATPGSARSAQLTFQRSLERRDHHRRGHVRPHLPAMNWSSRWISYPATAASRLREAWTATWASICTTASRPLKARAA